MLKERLKFLLKDTALYGIANAVSKFIAFITLPVMVRQLTSSEFGIWNLLMIAGSLMVAVAIFGMDSAAARYYYDDANSPNREKIFGHGFIIQVTLIFTLCASGFFFPGLLAKIVGVGYNHHLSLYIIVASIPALVLVQYFQNWFKWTFQRSRFLIISIGSAGLNLLLLVVCYTFEKINLNNVLLIQCIAVWVFTFLGLWWCRNYLVVAVDKSLLLKLTSFGFPMMLVFVISNLAPSLDRIFLVRYLSGDQLGIYSLCQKMSMIMVMAVTAFQTAFGPFAFSVWNNDDAPPTFSRFQSYYIMAAGVIGLVICSLGKPLVLILGTAEYLGTEKYLSFLVLGAIVYGLYSFASLGIFYSKKIGFNLLAMAIGITVNGLFNLLLIPQFKEYGAVTGFLCGNIALVTTGYLFSRKYYKIDFSVNRDILQIAILSVLITVASFSICDNVWADAGIKLPLITGAYLIFAVSRLSNHEKDFIRSKFRILFH
ncbi:MAG: oligosaccharide flippase family protein [Bacteroidetes bacterium]|nr:oligosaccharide flippase family protein [Bacteroidota bacterium]